MLRAGFTEVLSTGIEMRWMTARAKPTTRPVWPTGMDLRLVEAMMKTKTAVKNTSVNPARSIATAVFQGSWALNQLWVFIVFPIVGGILGAAIWKFLRPESDEGTLEESEEVAPAPFGKRDMPGQ
jgi:glycerol uptake facilitator-like aquaporin